MRHMHRNRAERATSAALHASMHTDALVIFDGERQTNRVRFTEREMQHFREMPTRQRIFAPAAATSVIIISPVAWDLRCLFYWFCPVSRRLVIWGKQDFSGFTHRNDFSTKRVTVATLDEELVI